MFLEVGYGKKSADAQYDDAQGKVGYGTPFGVSGTLKGMQIRYAHGVEPLGERDKDDGTCRKSGNIRVSGENADQWITEDKEQNSRSYYEKGINPECVPCVNPCLRWLP